MTAADQLTICSVSYGDGPLLTLNRRITERLNPGRVPRWLVVRNLPPHPQDQILGDAGGFDVVSGALLDPDIVGTRAPRSMHHALGMNVVPQHVDTRFVMFVDPDCFLLQPNWVADIVAHMLDRGLATFGVPYHPRARQKIRYVPCGVGMVVDTEQLPLAGIDWTPGTVAERDEGSALGAAARAMAAVLARAGLEHRLNTGSSVDTGIAFYRRHRTAGVATECVQSVMTPRHLRSRTKVPRECVLEVLLPDRFCMLPKRTGYITDSGLASLGHHDFAGDNCEEFFWQGQPFALHLRGGPPELREDLPALERALNALVSGVPHARPRAPSDPR